MAVSARWGRALGSVDIRCMAYLCRGIGRTSPSVAVNRLAVVGWCMRWGQDREQKKKKICDFNGRRVVVEICGWLWMFHIIRRKDWERYGRGRIRIAALYGEEAGVEGRRWLVERKTSRSQVDGQQQTGPVSPFIEEEAGSARLACEKSGHPLHAPLHQNAVQGFRWCPRVPADSTASSWQDGRDRPSVPLGRVRQQPTWFYSCSCSYLSSLFCVWFSFLS